MTKYYHSITFLAYSPQGTELVSVSADNIINIWEIKTGKEIQVLTKHIARITCLVYSPQGTELAIGGVDCTVRLWTLITKEERRILEGHTDLVSCLAYSPKGTELASGSFDKTVCLWEIATGKKLQVLTGHNDHIRCLTYSPQGTELVSGGDDSTICVWEIKTGKKIQVLNEHKASITCLTYLSDIELASGSADYTVQLWNLKQGICKILVNLSFLPLALNWFDSRLYVGMQARDKSMLVLVYKKTAKGYQCCTVVNPARASISWPQPFQQLKIKKARGLTAPRYRFLVSEGAVGKVEILTKRASLLPVGLLEEYGEIKRIMYIKEIVKQAKKMVTPHIRTSLDIGRGSIFKTNLKLTYQQWHVYLTGFDFDNNANSNIQNFASHDKKVYAILEGLSPLGQYLFIRFGLEQDNQDKHFGQIHIKSCSLPIYTNYKQLKIAMLGLLQLENPVIKTELTIYHVGSLFLSEMDKLLTNLLQEL
ncbi:MAG: WD40 repeat domain-containing protein, partial [Gammaproteobacteria bacterium]